MKIQECHMNDNTFYDEECIKDYGIRTCIIIKEITTPNSIHNKAELRFLDKIVKQKGSGTFYTTQIQLAEIIPNLLSYDYYVIIVDKTIESHTITAVHCPCKS